MKRLVLALGLGVVVSGVTLACGDGPAPAATAAGAADASSSTVTAPSGDAATATGDDAGLDATSTTGPLRLSFQGRHILGPDGQPMRLRGANFQGATAEEAAAFAGDLHLNLARLRLYWAPPNRDDAADTGFNADYLAQVDASIAALAHEHVWILLEMRIDDGMAELPDIYTPTSPTFLAYRKMWAGMARHLRGQDYIAGYGLLAEPTVERAGFADHAATLAAFHANLIGAITTDGGDARTPIFVGAGFHYDPMELWNDTFYTGLAAYAGRVAWEVNFLMPKPWIDKGTNPDGVVVGYPQVSALPYSTLLTVKQGEHYTLPDDAPRVLNARLDEPANYPLTLTAGFPAFYWQYPLAFAAKHEVPLLADQFGAAIEKVSHGQLAYEKNLVDFFEANEIHWCRWAYNAGESARMIAPNADVVAFYRGLGAGYPRP